MARSGTPAGFIIQTLRDSRTRYAISAEQAATLRSRGVPEEVLAYLRYGEQGITNAPAYPLEPFTYGYPYGYWPYGFNSPYWGYPYGPGYPRSSLYFGFGQHW